jgi:two-component system sensor histidine kinase KdpD
MRAALLATLGHDLRSPLAAAKAALSGLQSTDVQLTAADRGELLSAADESLDRLARLAAGLLDLSRLQAGKVSVFPQPRPRRPGGTQRRGSWARHPPGPVRPGVPPVPAGR